MDKVILVALVLCLLTMLTGFAGNPEAQHEEPSLTLPRYDEDYSYLRSPANRTGKWWEPLKFIPLTEKAYFSLGSALWAWNSSLSFSYEFLHDTFALVQWSKRTCRLRNTELLASKYRIHPIALFEGK